MDYGGGGAVILLDAEKGCAILKSIRVFQNQSGFYVKADGICDILR